MIVIVGLFAFVIPALIWKRGEKNKSRIAAYLKKRGYSEKNPVAIARLKKARKHAAIAYSIVVLLLLFASRNIHMIDDMLIMSIFWFLIGQGVYKAVNAWSFKAQESFSLGGGDEADLGSSTEVLQERDQRWIKQPVPLVPRNEHGSADIRWAEENGMADPDALLPPGGAK